MPSTTFGRCLGLLVTAPCCDLYAPRSWMSGEESESRRGVSATAYGLKSRQRRKLGDATRFCSQQVKLLAVSRSFCLSLKFCVSLSAKQRLRWSRRATIERLWRRPTTAAYSVQAVSSLCSPQDTQRYSCTLRFG